MFEDQYTSSIQVQKHPLEGPIADSYVVIRSSPPKPQRDIFIQDALSPGGTTMNKESTKTTMNNQTGEQQWCDGNCLTIKVNNLDSKRHKVTNMRMNIRIPESHHRSQWGWHGATLNPGPDCDMFGLGSNRVNSRQSPLEAEASFQNGNNMVSCQSCVLSGFAGSWIPDSVKKLPIRSSLARQRLLVRNNVKPPTTHSFVAFDNVSSGSGAFFFFFLACSHIWHASHVSLENFPPCVVR